MTKAMLLTEIDADGPEAEELLNNPRYVAQQKLDGCRVLVHVGNWSLDEAVFQQRNGKPLKFAAATQHIPTLTTSLLRALGGFETHPERILLDGELIVSTGEFWLFDMVHMDREPRTYRQRLCDLNNLVHPNMFVKIVPTNYTTEAKITARDWVEREGGEGIVLKDLEGYYQPGARVKDQVKLKFTKTADVVALEVTRGRNEAGREVGSVTFGVRVPFLEQNLHARTFVEDFGGQGLENCYAAVGSCSLIGKPEVKVGDVLEVKYLYRDDRGGLIQPRLVSVREDKAPWECLMAQFPSYTRRVFQ